MASSNKKRINKYNSFFRSKEILVGFVAIFSAAFIVGSFAWFTSSDYKMNKFSGTKLIVEINEEFYPNKEWKPGELTKKEVRVENTGEVDSFIRVSLYEFLLMFQIDTTDRTGNGNLKTVEKVTKPVVDSEDVNTWSKAAESGGTYTWYANNYVADQVVVPDWKNKKNYYQYDEKDRDERLKKIKLLLGNVVTSIPSSDTENYWLYENGYFYYSKPLKPKEKSDMLLKGVSLDPSAANKYKGSLYQMKVLMDAHDVTDHVLSSWSVKSTDQANKIFEKYLQ